jgi:hypothetical protein
MRRPDMRFSVCDPKHRRTFAFRQNKDAKLEATLFKMQMIAALLTLASVAQAHCKGIPFGLLCDEVVNVGC